MRRVKQLFPSLLVIILPVVVLIITQTTPLLLVSNRTVQGILPWCLTPAEGEPSLDVWNGLDPTIGPIQRLKVCRPLPDGDKEARGGTPTKAQDARPAGGSDRPGPPDPKAGPAGAAPPSQPGVGPAGASPPSQPGVGPAGASPPVSSQQASPGGQTDNAAKTSPRTFPQVRAAELDARLKFGGASAFLRALSLIAAVFAITQLVLLYRRARQIPLDSAQVPPDKERRFETAVAWVLPLILVVLGIGFAVFQASHDWFRDAFIMPALVEAQAYRLAGADASRVLSRAAFWNVMFGYTAAALLLAYLAGLAFESIQPLRDEHRIVGVQFVLVAGAALFTTSVLANKGAIAWARAALDKAASHDVLQSMDRVADLWAFAASAFLLTAVGCAYFAIRGREATMGGPVGAAAGPALALRTPTGEDFKALGWLINIMIALAPVWLSEGLSKLAGLSTGMP